MNVDLVPKLAIGGLLLIVPIFLIIGLFIFAIVKSGKSKGLLVALGIFGLIAVVLLGGLFSFRASGLRRVESIRLQNARATLDPATRHEDTAEEEILTEEELASEGAPRAEVYQRPRRGFAPLSILLLIAVIVMIGLFIFAASNFGKGKSSAGMIALFVGVVVPGVVLVGLNVLHFGGMAIPMRLPMFLIPVLLILGLIVYAAIKSGNGKGLLVVLGIGGAVALALVFMLKFVSAPVRRTVEPIRVQAVQATGEPAIWHEGVEKEFLADVYPSKRAAVLALGRQVAETIIESSLADTRISREIGLLQDDHDRGLLTKLARQIEQHSTQESVTCRVLQNLDSNPWRTDPDNIMVTQLKLLVRLGFDDVKTKRMSWNDDKVSSGKAWLKVKGPDGISNAEMRFTEKPWVESFQDFLSSNPSRDLALARSGNECMSQQEAHRQAVADAMMKISRMLRSVQNNPSVVPANMAISENDLLSGKFIADTFTQRFSGLVGPIWREAILIDTSQSKLNDLAQQKIRFSRDKRLTWAKMAGTLIGMFALICVVYLFLNAATRGYYTWALRIVLMILLGIGVLVVLNFA